MLSRLTHIGRPVPRGLFRTPQRGFALLITVTLLAFLVLLLVSLASLTRVETQVAANSQQIAQARQNALLALNVALGHLQKYTGPDQRVTARADLLTTYADGPVATDAESSATYANFWNSRSRSWTGVWGNTTTNIGYSLVPSQIAAPGNTPTLIGWLVSGNEGGTFTLGGTGQTLSPSTPKFTPDLQVTGLTAGIDPVTATLTFPVANAAAGTSTTSGVLLVGPGSTSGGSAADLAQNYVVAPLVDIQVPANVVPGLSGATATSIGRYAYWVGDEGVKARVNVRDSYLQQTTAADQTAYQPYSFITAQRSAVELVNYDSANTLQLTDYPAPSASAAVDKLFSTSQLPLLGGTAGAQTNLQSASRSRFHDLTTASYGVLADTYTGGLKKDITADIADPTTTAVGNRPADTAPLFPRQVATDRVPTWGLLRSFPRTVPDASGRLTPSLPPASSTSDTVTGQNISPVINFAGLGVDFFLDSSNKIQVALFPVVILWNPYSAKMAANTYEIGFRIGPLLESGVTQQMRCFIQVKDDPAAAEHTVATLDMGAGDLIAGSGSASPGFIRFKLDCSELAPGEAQVYMPGSAGLSYVAGQTTLVRSPVKSDGTLPVTDNYVTWTLPGMAINQAVVTGGGSMRVYAARNLDGGIYSMDVVLSQPGKLSGWDGSSILQSNWYQTVTDGNLGQEPRILNDSSPKDIFNTAPFSGMADRSNGPTTYMRLTAGMEGHGAINSNPRNTGVLGPNIGNGGSVRWLLVANPRAPVVRNTLIENQGYLRGNTLLGGKINLTAQPNGNTFGDLFPYNGRTSGYNTKIGSAQDNGSLRAVLFDVLASPDLLLSLGQLQHASLAAYSYYSTYPFGNSWAPVQMPRQSQYQTNDARLDFGATQATVYDLSWHLNRALWDRYFVSDVPSSWTAADVAAGRALPDGRMTYVHRNGSPPALSDLQYSGGTDNAYDRAAANLLVKGAFNINSTSEQAWRVLLGGTYQLPANPAYADSGDAVGAVAAVPRFSGNQSQTGYTNSMTQEGGGNYLGNRGLRPTSTNPAYQPDTTQAVINELARSIVAEIRARGPFLSLADFVNRRLVPYDPSGSGSGDTGIRGTLQAAIDKMGTTAASSAAVNTGAWTSSSSDIRLIWKPRAAWDTEHYFGGSSTNIDSKNATRFAACPKYLTQADLLSTLGPALSARSDTFRIRTYGDVKNPATGAITGRAWCEAIVQRMPDYLNASADAPETPRASLTDINNKKLGRRFTIVGFRWLTPSDI